MEGRTLEKSKVNVRVNEDPINWGSTKSYEVKDIEFKLIPETSNENGEKTLDFILKVKKKERAEDEWEDGEIRVVGHAYGRDTSISRDNGVSESTYHMYSDNPLTAFNVRVSILGTVKPVPGRYEYRKDYNTLERSNQTNLVSTHKVYQFHFILRNLSKLIDILDNKVEEYTENKEGKLLDRLIYDSKYKSLIELILKYVKEEDIDNDLDNNYQELKEELGEDFNSKTYLTILKDVRYETVDEDIEELPNFLPYELITEDSGRSVQIQRAKGDSERVYHLPVQTKTIEFKYSGEAYHSNQYGESVEGLLDLVIGSYKETREEILSTIKDIEEGEGLLLDIRTTRAIRPSSRIEVGENEGGYTNITITIYFTFNKSVIDFYTSVVNRQIIHMSKNNLEGIPKVNIRYSKSGSVYNNELGIFTTISSRVGLKTKGYITQYILNNRIRGKIVREEPITYKTINQEVVRRVKYELGSLDNLLEDKANLVNFITQQFRGVGTSVVEGESPSIFHATDSDRNRVELDDSLNNLHSRINISLTKLDPTLHQMYIEHVIKQNSYLFREYREISRMIHGR